MKAWHRLLMPVILATKEAEIKIEVWGQPGQTVPETLPWKKGPVERLRWRPEFKPQYHQNQSMNESKIEKIYLILYSY
jgi:hypothetical protein